MTVSTFALMNIFHDVGAWVTGGVTGCIPDKIRCTMLGMTNRTIGMAIKTTNGQCVILDNSLHTGITSLNVRSTG